MWTNTLSNRVFKLLLITMISTSLVLLVSVWKNTSGNIRKALEEKLVTAHNVLINEIALHKNNTSLYAQTILLEPSTLRGLMSDNAATQAAAITNIQTKLQANFVAITDASGNILHASALGKPSISNFGHKQHASNRNISILTANDSDLFFNILLSFNAQENLYLLVNHRVEQSFLQQLKSILGVDITIHLPDQGKTPFTTLPDEVASVRSIQQTLISNDSDFFSSWRVLLGDQQYYSRLFPLKVADEDTITHVYLSAKATELSDNFWSLHSTIGSIALISIFLALFFGRLLSRDITKPIESVAQYAQSIAEGKYSKPITFTSGTNEVGQLIDAFNTMQKNIKTRERKIIESNRIDPLTQLYTRPHVKDIIQREYVGTRDFQAISINILGFKGINDVFGHQSGDTCLQSLSQRMEHFSGLKARLNGGALLWVPDGFKTEDELAGIKNSLELPVYYSDLKIPLRLTIGFIDVDSTTKSSEDVFKRLNLVIDEAKNKNFSILAFDSSIENRYLRRLSIITNLKRVLFEDADELAIHYQPKLSLKTNQVNSVEALIRWNNASLGNVPPDEFIGIAEQAGLITHLTRWVIRRACRDLDEFKRKGIDISVAINISAGDLLDDAFANTLKRNLSDYHLAESSLTIELTESVMVSERSKAVRRLRMLQKEGFKVALDDFGTGYSSLEYLARLPIDTIKIDRGFVKNLIRNKHDHLICKTIIDLADKFDLEVVAEGIEDNQTLQLLSQWGCTQGQGYFISRPLVRDDYITWHQERQGLPLASSV